MVCYGIFSLKWSIGLIHYTTLHPTSLHALRTDGIKSMLRGFSHVLRGQTSEKKLPMEEIAVEFVYSGQQEMKTFSS